MPPAYHRRSQSTVTRLTPRPVAHGGPLTGRGAFATLPAGASSPAHRSNWFPGDGMADLPSGTVTFLLTDIEGSTALWEHAPEAMRQAVARHDALLATTIEGRGGS